MSSKSVPVRWFDNPDRSCAGDDRYADLTLVEKIPGITRNDQILEMQRACMSCPVYYDCLTDLRKFPKEQHYGVRAGLRGMT